MANPDFRAEFQNRNVLVTGAGRGLGKRLALGFARLGARLILVGRNKAELDLAHIEIEQAGGNALKVRADVTDPEQMELAVHRASVTFGSGIDVLVCAAGVVGPLGSFAQASLKQWATTVNTNLLGAANAIHAVLPGMIERRRGKIIALACESDTAPKLNFSAYTSSKAALVRLVEALAMELLHDNIQVNSLDPGPAYTSITDEIISAEAQLQPAVVAEAKEVRRTGGASPNLQLEHVMLLASERSNHITGKLIHIHDDLKKLVNQSIRPDALTLRRVTK
jgi:3-oxoacyl-[acyl-carrier protein] reductase